MFGRFARATAHISSMEQSSQSLPGRRGGHWTAARMETLWLKEVSQVVVCRTPGVGLPP